MQETSRTKNSLFNVSSNFVVYMIKNILGFITRTIFIKILGETYLGVNGLLTNVLSMLSLAELGISSAISFGLYKPLVEGDNSKVSAIMTFFKKVYEIIGIIVLVFGVVLYFFLDKMIKEYNSIPQLNIIYILYLINTVSTYYTAYKEILITADQKAYKLTKINIIFTTLLNTLQIIVLLIFKNFIAYLITQFFVQIAQKIATNIYITKEYKEINFKSKQKLEDGTLKTIKKNVKAMMFHKIGEYCIYGTDNIIISRMIDVATVGFYSNYNLIITMINSVITMIYNNITASFGNLLVNEDKSKNLEIFKKIDFMSFIMHSFCGIIFLAVASRFINIWLGSKFMLEQLVVMLISFSFFFTGLRVTSAMARNAAGLYNEDKWVPIAQSIINIVVSIILTYYMGLAGVILGTIISSILPNYYRSYILFKNIFIEKYYKYILKYNIPYLVVFIAIAMIIYAIDSFIKIEGIYGFVLSLIVAILVYSILIYIIFRKYKEFNYLKDVLKNILNKVLNKLKGGRTNGERTSNNNNTML
ncbi:MAG: oligosaccharide flippase family protein [Clostridia bacterium]|nr:oligosaccharide flippase family protein [Clostridia bacterium]